MIAIDVSKTATLLKIKRIGIEYSVSQIAKYLGVTQAAVYNWEKGRKIPSIENLIALSLLYDCHVEDLIYWEVVDD